MAMAAPDCWHDYQTTSKAFFDESFSRLRAYAARGIVAEGEEPACRVVSREATCLSSALTSASSPHEAWSSMGGGIAATLQLGWEEDFALRNLTMLPENGGVLQGLTDMIESQARARAVQAKLRWKMRKAELFNRITHLSLKKSYFANRAKGALDSVHLRESLYGKRLEYQSRNATRRLQELVFECIGEYEKTHRRAVGRASFLHSDCENQVRQAVDALQWTRFAQRLTEDWMGWICAEYLDPRLSPEEFHDYAAKAASALEGGKLSTTTAKVKKVVKLNPGPGVGRRRPVGGPSAGSSSTPTASSSPVCTDVVAVTGVLWKAAERVDRRLKRVHPQVAFSDGGAESLALTTRASAAVAGSKEPLSETLLSCAGIKWLLAADDRWTGSWAPEPINTRIYYCVEERARRGLGNVREQNSGKGRAEALASYLEAVYVDGSCLPRKETLVALGHNCARAVRLLLTSQRVHSKAIQSFPGDLSLLEGYPDVVQAEMDVGQQGEATGAMTLRVHMACATVLQLVESQAFADMMGTLPIALQEDLQAYHGIKPSASPPIVTHFFVALPSPSPPPCTSSSSHASNALLPSVLIPLCPRTIHELLHLYLLQPPARTLSALDHTSLTATASAMSVFPPSLPSEQKHHHHHHTKGPLGQWVLRHKYAVIFHPLAGEQEEPHQAGRIFGGSGSNGGAAATAAGAAAILVEFDEVERKAGGHPPVTMPDSKPMKDARGEHECKSTTTTNKKIAARWDPTIVGPHCRWRSCLEPAGERNVCAFHGEVRRLLDSRCKGSSGGGGKAGGGKDKNQSEAARYLLRKPLSTSTSSVVDGVMVRRGTALEADMKALLHASSLLEELMSGKLANTVRSFCQRAAMESGDKFQAAQRRKMMAAGGGKSRRRKAAEVANNTVDRLVEVPWARWRSWEELRRRSEALDAEIEAAYQVRKIERAITSELHQLSALGVYPSMELQQIRREYEEMVHMAEEEQGGDEEEAHGGDEGVREMEDEDRYDSSGRVRRHCEPGSEADISRQRELDFAERKHQLLRQRRLREGNGGARASQQHQPGGEDRTEAAPPPLAPPDKRFDAPVRPFQAIPPPQPGIFDGSRLNLSGRSDGQRDLRGGSVPPNRQHPYAQSIMAATRGSRAMRG